MEEATSPRFWRQMDIVVPKELPAVTVIGAGGIGSFAILALAKMGVENITTIDDDRVEDHNLPNQLYGPTAIGQHKVNAAADICSRLAGVGLDFKCKRLGRERLSGVVISGVDSMASRKDIWSKVKYKPSIPLYVEARMGAEVSRIYSINPCSPEQIEFYEQYLYNDEDASEAPCTSRAIIYNGFAIASLIANQVKKWSKKEELHKEIIFDLKTLTLMIQ